MSDIATVVGSDSWVIVIPDRCVCRFQHRHVQAVFCYEIILSQMNLYYRFIFESMHQFDAHTVMPVLM